jgi:hypothetical protein
MTNQAVSKRENTKQTYNDFVNEIAQSIKEIIKTGGDKNTKKQQDSDIKKSRQLLEEIKRGTYEQSNIEQL